MKRPKRSEKASFSKKGRHGQRERSRNGNQMNEMLKLCLEKVCQLQKDLEKQDELEDDPQAAGYAACAIETLRFLAQEGLPEDHPMVQVLTDKLTGDNP